MLLLISTLLLGLAIAQRPSSASICDYYAQARYGSNSSESQYQLIEGIVALAFGGNHATSNASSNLTGIWNEGSWQNNNVNLRPYFNGSIDSTNLNNAPVGIDWLDGGGLDPLYSYLNGTASSVSLDSSSNQGRLFSHWYTAFGRIFGCSSPPQPPPSTTGQTGPINPAYVHKYMNLNYSDIGYFINQLTLAAQYFGFSEQDAQTLNQQMNSNYNVQCAPPVNGMLLSLCQANDCPLAVPNPDCAAYDNLTANGVASAAPSSGSATAKPTAFTPSSVVPTTTPTSTSAPSSSPAATASASSLSPGAIAGIAIGGAAVLLLAVAMFLFWRYKNKQNRQHHPSMPPSSIGAPSVSQMHTSPSGYMYQQSAPSETTYGSPMMHDTGSPPLKEDRPVFEVEGNQGFREIGEGRRWR